MALVELNLPAKKAYEKRQQEKPKVVFAEGAPMAPLGFMLEIGKKYVTNEGVVIGPMEHYSIGILKAKYKDADNYNHWNPTGVYTHFTHGYPRSVYMKWHEYWEVEKAMKEGADVEYMWTNPNMVQIYGQGWKLLTAKHYSFNLFHVYQGQLEWRIKKVAA